LRKDETVKPTVKAWLALVDSDTDNWGLVEDTRCDLTWVPGKGEIVGTWSRTEYDGLIHIGIETAVSALQDRAVQVWAKYADERRVQKATGKKPGKAKTRKPEEATIPPAELSIEEKLAFNSLRARLKGPKSG